MGFFVKFHGNGYYCQNAYSVMVNLYDHTLKKALDPEPTLFKMKFL